MATFVATLFWPAQAYIWIGAGTLLAVIAATVALKRMRAPVT